ncbi:MAG: amidohydrolase family protein, partial [Candidatus Thermoplasmatota archaeon]
GFSVGADWDETRWPDPRYLTRDDLDRVSATVPVAAIRVDLHMASVNSAALGILSIPPHTRGFEIDASGHPTGVLKEEAFARIWDFIWPSPDRFAKSFPRVARAALALGITTVHDIVNETELRAYQIAKAGGHLPLRVYMMARDPLLPHFAAAGLARGFGDEWLRLGAIKVFSDGSLGARTAALLEPYADEPRETGCLIHSPDELRTLVARIHEAGFQAAVHAVGDCAIETVVDAMERAIPDGHSLRHRIEHAELLHPEHIDRMKDHGIVASCQPNFVGRWSFPGGMYERRLGLERLRRNNPYREILEKPVV